jgi:hypothetical protein
MGNLIFFYIVFGFLVALQLDDAIFSASLIEELPTLVWLIFIIVVVLIWPLIILSGFILLIYNVIRGY